MTNRSRRWTDAIGALFVSVFAAAPSSASAQEAANFYKGRQISWILSAGEGGGYSTYAKAFAPFFSAHIPGRPAIVVQNMPGAGGLRAMIHLASVANKDGTVIGLVHSGVPLAPLFGIQGATYDPRTIRWIGSLNKADAICVAWASSGIARASDLMTKEFVVGGTGAGSQMEMYPLMLNRLFGTRIKIVSGYKGGNEVYLAMERGEVHGRCGGGLASLNSTRPDWLPGRKVAIPIVFAMERVATLPDVMVAGEFAKDDRTRQMLRLILAPQAMDRPILAPPGTPPERLTILRRAFHLAFGDPGFKAEAQKMGLDIDEISGERIEAIITEAYAMPPDIVKGAIAAFDMTSH